MSKQQYVEQLFNSMGQLKKLFQNLAQESHEDKAATMMQYSALKCLKENQKSKDKSITVGDIAAHLKLSKSSATQLIERLVKAKLVERIDDELDRRIVRLVISPLGEQEIIDLKKKFIDRMSKILSKVPDKDLQELVRIQTSLIETLQKEQK